MHLRVITSVVAPFANTVMHCVGGNFEAIHMELIGKRELGKQYCRAPGHNINIVKIFIRNILKTKSFCRRNIGSRVGCSTVCTRQKMFKNSDKRSTSVYLFGHSNFLMQTQENVSESRNLLISGETLYKPIKQYQD